ncbi:hypothetical protein BOO69_00685 [Sulfitobacter alexandrii]|uniref:Peptidase S74 domain-containing protein n=1 Tax=Sulfitobacter alexandrii TaxID=1917485 RepID=A0A1J0WD28_9RHOB|nr:hypothetical protein [Sulfitobacter alexandrii]APE42088.1 hypothetical protein BOO69_00685 [Sulfitobacter alexandrii]
MSDFANPKRSGPALAAGMVALATGMLAGHHAYAQDQSIIGSLCVGQDCTSSESYGFDTIRLKENNLRIRAFDTSSTGSFPTVDWQLTFNDTDNGGANKFSIDDIDNSRTPFTIEAGTRTNQLYVSDSNRVGFGTSTPVVDLHVKQGNTPALRLEQDGSSGFAAQTWDVASNETNFFIRDVTGGSTLPFRIQPGAPTSALYIANNGEVGMGAGTTPNAALHIRRTGAPTDFLIESSGASNDSSFILKTDGQTPASWEFRAQASSGRLNIGIVGGNTPIKIDESANNNLLKIGDNTNSDAVIVTGQIIVNGTPLNVPDYVFEPDYKLLPLAEVQAFIDENGHLPGVPSAKKINDEQRFNVVEMQLKLLEKVEELTLYTLEQEATISELKAQVETLKSAN